MTETDPTRALRDTLIKETFEWCKAKSPFYQNRFAEISTFSGLADLYRIPVLTRSEVVANHKDICCDPSLPTSVQFTTGTTGQYLHLYRGQAEQAFIWEFFSAQLQASPPPDVKPLCMNLVNVYHGNLINVPSRAFVLPVGVFDRAQATQARSLLERTYDFPGVENRISTLSGTERMVMALTAYLMAEGVDLARSSVKRIVLFGGHVPSSRKKLLSELWQAQITDQYSLTEIFGGAKEYGPDGTWLFDPHVVPEVVHPVTHKLITEGVGVLVLSELYPFVQQMPMLRYFTGDLVTIVQGADAPGGLQVRYLGRLVRSILDTSGPEVKPLLLSGPLYSALIDIPDIAVSPRFPDLNAGPGLELTGDLHYAIEHRPAEVSRVEEITIRLGLRYAPWMYSDRVAEVVDKLVTRLFETHPEMASRCAAKTLKLQVLPCHATAVPPYDSK